MSRYRGKPKPSLRDLSRMTPSDEESEAITNAIIKAPPVVTAIWGVAIIDTELEQLLRKRIPRKDEKTWERLTEENGPFNTFYAKIMLGYAFRIYDETLEKNFHIVRRIRNMFAHARKPIAFDHELVVAELKKVELPRATRSRLYRQLEIVKSLAGGPSMAYANLCFILAIELIRKDRQAIQAKACRLRRRHSILLEMLTEHVRRNSKTETLD